MQERPWYSVGQDQGERARTTQPFLLRGLDSAGSGVHNLHRESGTRCRLRQTLACTQAAANCTRPAKGRIGDRLGDSVGREAGFMCSSSYCFLDSRAQSLMFLLHLSYRNMEEEEMTLFCFQFLISELNKCGCSALKSVMFL